MEHNRPLDESDDELNLVDNDQPGIQEEVIDEVSENEEKEEIPEHDDPFIDTQDDQTIAVSRRTLQGGEIALQRSPPEGPKRTSLTIRLLYAIVALGICGAVINFKRESSPIGVLRHRTRHKQCFGTAQEPAKRYRGMQ